MLTHRSRWRRSRFGAVLTIAMLVCMALASSPATAAQPPDLRVMSFNIRVGSADQGTPNDWDLRKPIVAQTISNYNPDLLGMQEALRYQWIYLEGELPGYQEVGKSVNDDGTGEYAAIFYKKSRFTELDKGNFWLEPNNTPGVLAWDATFPRIATWVKLKDVQNPSNTFVFMNTHWDAAGADARFESAKLMRSTVASMFPNLPIIFSGDFNADQGGAAYRRMTGLDNGDSYPDYADTYREIHPEDSATVGTSLGFDGVGNNDGRIDWILHDDGFTTIDANIDRSSFNGKYPSDHFPINALIRAVPEPATIGVWGVGTCCTLLVRRRR
jgi:endonuclease/exonuclease/phosphatase family metal-dependent hydrolase